MKKLLLSLLATVTLAFGGGDVYIAAAPIAPICPQYKTGLYGGLSGTYNDSEIVTAYGYGTDDGYGIQGQLGYRWFGMDNLSLSLEGRLGSTGGDTIDINYVAAYLKPEVVFYKSFSLYGLIGYGETEIDIVNVASNSVDDFSYGAGLGYGMNENMVLVLDFVVLPNTGNGNQNSDTDLVTLGFNYNF